MSTFLPIDEWGDITTIDGLNKAVAAFVTARRTPTDPRHGLAANADGLTIPAYVNFDDWAIPPISPQDGYRIIDLREGTTFVHVPLLPGHPTKAGGYSLAATALVGTVMEHQPPPGPGAPAAGVVLQRVIHGGSSTSCQLLRSVINTGPKAGRWYPAAMEGISPGQALVVQQADLKNIGSVIVAHVGWDPNPPPPLHDPDDVRLLPLGPLPYFTVAAHAPPGDLPLPPLPLPATTRIQRKTAIGALAVIEEDHTLNQQGALNVAKYAYSDGDATGVGISLNYQGDFASAGGDEGGLGATAELVQDLQLFSGAVEDFAQETIGSGTDQRKAWVLTYRAQPHLNVERLATGRPIINLNRHKWIQGTCRVWATYPTPALSTYQVVEVPGSSLPPEVVGRFLSINEPSEYIDPNDTFSTLSGLQPFGIGIVRRWFQITDLQIDQARGSQLLQVRFKLFDAIQGGIQLVDPGHLNQDVKFIIAPGGIPYDVSRAVAENDNNIPPVPRKILIQPNPDTEKRLNDSTYLYPFDKDDVHDPNDPQKLENPPYAIAQALGSRSVNPTGFRVRHHTSWPTLEMGYYDASFYAVNFGAAQVGIGLMIQGAGRTSLADDKTRFRGPTGAAYGTGVWINATTQTAIRVQGDVAGTNDVNFLPPGQPAAGVALRMDQAGGPAARKVIGWTTETGQELVSIGYDPATKSFQIAGAETVKLVGAKTGAKTIGWTTGTGQELVNIGYDPATKSFQIAGAETVKLVGAKTFDLGGAALANPAKTAPPTGSPILRGTKTVPPTQSASHGATPPQTVTATVTFPTPISEDYIAMVTPGWVTGFGVTKQKNGFTVTFDTAPPPTPPGQSGQDKFDWIIY
jgi:hypothetical protein